MDCDFLVQGAIRDGMERPDKRGCCKKGWRKVLLVIQDASVTDANGNKGVNDYHWYRQEPDGSWSHKRGDLAPQTTDASGDPIKDPEKADRHHSGTRDYDKSCGYLCSPPNMNVD